MNWVNWLMQVLQAALALATAPLLVGWVNQCRAWLQNRSAPSVLQPYRTIRKLFHKDAIIAVNASSLFRLAPYVVFGTMVAAAAMVPTVGTGKRRFEAIKGEIPSPINPPSGCAFHPRCPHAGPRCRIEAPRLTDAGQGRTVACHLNDGGVEVAA